MSDQDENDDRMMLRIIVLVMILFVKAIIYASRRPRNADELEQSPAAATVVRARTGVVILDDGGHAPAEGTVVVAMESHVEPTEQLSTDAPDQIVGDTPPTPYPQSAYVGDASTAATTTMTVEEAIAPIPRGTLVNKDTSDEHEEDTEGSGNETESTSFFSK